MSKKAKRQARTKKPQQGDTLSKIVLATAIIELVRAIIELIIKLIA